MHWILHAGIGREPAYLALANAIARRGMPVSFVHTADGARRLVETDVGGTAIVRDDAPEVDPSCVYVVGTISMAPLCAALGWKPGYVDAPVPSECALAWGDRMLNADARFLTVSEAVSDRPVFIRPDGDDKGFTGHVLDAERLAAWRTSVLAGEVPGLSAETVVAIASPKAIWSEYRCILVDGRYVTGSRYRTGRTVAYSGDVGGRIVRFAESLVADWRPRRIMCVDVADTPDGLKAIEANAPSSAGLYAIDCDAYVAAISDIM